jgi:hypothetical protein
LDNCGYFLFSLDTELASGQFDQDEIRRKWFSNDGVLERQAILRLIDLCGEYKITGTWAIVGHLFYEKCVDCNVCPLMNWKGKYSSFEEVYGTNNPLWYGPDIIEAILSRGSKQEIAFHGFSHNIFDEEQMSLQEANVEIQTWLRLAKEKGIIPHAVTFPRSRVGHLEALREAGLICYRGEPNKFEQKNRTYVGKFIKTIDHLLGISEIPIFDLTNNDNQGLLNIRESQYLFDFNRKLELFLDRLNLHNVRIGRIVKGVRKAAQSKKILHIWAHPCEFRTEKDFSKLRHIFDAVSEQIKNGQMRSVGMTEMAKIIIKEDFN